MTPAEKQSAVAELMRVIWLIEKTPHGDAHELLRLAALMTYQLQRLTHLHPAT